ncbi:MAG: ribonuclease III [Epsilonproteobacteria bacterium]|nr:ribonuclease III [Campylobacterota bacterium]
MRNENIEEFYECLGYTFKNKDLITEALTHKSYTRDYNNERLEFLGDAVLDLVVGEFLFDKFKDSEEGVLSKLRASLVNENSFMKLANEIRLGEFIYISPAEEHNNGRTKPSILSNAFEAVMGAVYLEAGLETVRNIALNLIVRVYKEIDPNKLLKDYKTTLQEITQAHFGCTPDYLLVASTGPDHKKEFEICVQINDKTYASAKGHSKKVAQQNAAKLTIELLKKELQI